MTKKEQETFIQTILKQQAVIHQQSEKIRLLEIIIDNLTKELELSRTK